MLGRTNRESVCRDSERCQNIPLRGCTCCRILMRTCKGICQSDGSGVGVAYMCMGVCVFPWVILPMGIHIHCCYNGLLIGCVMEKIQSQST